VTPNGLRIALGDIADVYVEEGPPGLKSENARLNGWTFVDIEGVDIGRYVENAQKIVADQVTLPAGYSLNWSGQYEYMQRGERKADVCGASDIGHYYCSLYINFRNFSEVAIIMAHCPLPWWAVFG